MGNDGAPLLVIDDFAGDPEALIRSAIPRHFRPRGRYFPGIRARAPLSYQRYLTGCLEDLLPECFCLHGPPGKLSMCHYSLVTTPPADLAMAQRIPHLDATDRSIIATIHYLFRGEHGGTAFYRHRKTGFEYVDEARRQRYFETLEAELKGPDAPSPEYIDGDTPLFQRIAAHDGAFNRLLVYWGNSLHSGSIDRNFLPDPNPLTGRLSINSFIEVGF